MIPSATTQVSPNDRFGRLVERNDGADFPFYDGRPAEVVTARWVLVVVACAAGIAILFFYPAATNVKALVPRMLFTALPMVVFIAATRPFWRSIFRPVRFVDVLTTIAFWLLNLAVTAAVGAVVATIFGAKANPATAGLIAENPIGIAAFYIGTGVQLFGEELFTILPFLATLYWLHTKGRRNRRTAIVLAWLITAAWFGAAHLSTYGFNFAQAFLIIGVARLVLTLAYIRTKNIWVSTGAHVLNDWSTFTFVLIAALARS